MASTNQGDDAVSRLDAAVTAFEEVLTGQEGQTVTVPGHDPQPTLAERVKQSLKPSTDTAENAAQQAEISKNQAVAAAAEARRISGLEDIDDVMINSGLSYGGPSGRFALSGAAFRRNTKDSQEWKMVTDPTHVPVNTFSITGGVDLEITYQGRLIGALVCGVDESLAIDGVFVGGSVGPDRAIISMGAPCSFVVDLDNDNAIKFDNKFFDISRFQVSISAGGQITIGHPQRRLMQSPIVQFSAANSQFEYLVPHYVNEPTLGGFSFFLIGEAEGVIAYNGSKWVISSSAWINDGVNDEVSFSYDAVQGRLDVTHPSIIGSPGISIDPIYNGASFNTQVGSSKSQTSFSVFFRKPDGSIPSLSSALSFEFSRGMSAIRKKPSGKIKVYLGNVKVNCNHVDYEFGNFWTIGLMGD
ncbi:hypothetical protein GWQ31_10105 [Aeromonas sp. 2MA4]|uniref:hypothetical protein n=1 Tax=Aeromonas sp. 2MA4 TaxID=2699195 RepID=UPI0023DDF3CF|nr:hypothetical protein [Aeromonas sp. 2MA4]MDF2391702.1 hypothetical protein [Aeromonas sp. 2MA4]